VQTAILTGVFALIGVVIGGFLNAWLAARAARLSDQRATLVAARALHADLRMAVGAMKSKADTRAIEFALTGQAWREHRDQLTAVLSDEEWERIEAAYALISIEVRVAEDETWTSLDDRSGTIAQAQAAMAILHPRTAKPSRRAAVLPSVLTRRTKIGPFAG
jgi:hypothetical protein